MADTVGLIGIIYSHRFLLRTLLLLRELQRELQLEVLLLLLKHRPRAGDCTPTRSFCISTRVCFSVTSRL